MVVRLAQQACTIGSCLNYCNSHVFMLRQPSRRQLILLIWSHLWLHWNICFNPYRGDTENWAHGHFERVNMQTKTMAKPPWLCIPCYHSSTLQTNDVMFLLGRCGFRQSGAGCLATGYRKKMIKLLWCSFSPSLCIGELVAPTCSE